MFLLLPRSISFLFSLFHVHHREIVSMIIVSPRGTSNQKERECSRPYLLQSCPCSVVQATDGDRGHDVRLNSKLHPSLRVPEGCSCFWGLVPEHEHAPALRRKGRPPRKHVCPLCLCSTQERRAMPSH